MSDSSRDEADRTRGDSDDSIEQQLVELDLEPFELDALGLHVSSEGVNLELSAEPGDGNLLASATSVLGKLVGGVGSLGGGLVDGVRTAGQAVLDQPRKLKQWLIDKLVQLIRLLLGRLAYAAADGIAKESGKTASGKHKKPAGTGG